MPLLHYNHYGIRLGIHFLKDAKSLFTTRDMLHRNKTEFWLFALFCPGTNRLLYPVDWFHPPNIGHSYVSYIYQHKLTSNVFSLEVRMVVVDLEYGVSPR
jgi:hypothetical protein